MFFANLTTKLINIMLNPQFTYDLLTDNEYDQQYTVPQG